MAKKSQEIVKSWNVVPQEPKGIITLKKVVRHLSSRENVEWIKAGDLNGESDDACVDGRENNPIIGTPGGDIAIIAEAIVSLSSILGRNLSSVEIADVLRCHVETNGTFYHHTDTHALHNLMDSLNSDAHMPSFTSYTEVESFIRQPGRQYQVRLLEHLTNADNLGCGHLKLMMQDAGAYHVSRNVLRSLVRAFFDVMWNDKEYSSRVNYRVLEGEHTEGAVVNILLDVDEVVAETLVPKVRPNDKNGLSIFVNHPQVAHYQHMIVASGLVASGIFGDEITSSHIAAYISAMDSLLATGTRETVGRLAWGLPIFNILMKPETE